MPKPNVSKPDSQDFSPSIADAASNVGSSKFQPSRHANRMYEKVVAIDAVSDSKLGRLRHPRAMSVMENVAHIGDGGAVWLLLLVLFGRSSPRPALRAIGALAVSSMVVNGPVKKIWSRPRPVPHPGSGFRPHGSSFPSGHSFSSWLMVALLPPVRGLWLLAVPVAALITSSRVFLRYHHASDVLAGSLFGVFAGWLLRRFVRWR